MKPLLPLLSIFFFSTIHAQKPVHTDSSWSELVTDTTFGTIEYDVSTGKMVAPAILVEYQTFEASLVTSKYRKTTLTKGEYKGASEKSVAAFIKIKGEWKQVTRNFVFKPD